MIAVLIGLAVGLLVSLAIFWAMDAFEKPHPIYGETFGLNWKEIVLIVAGICFACVVIAVAAKVVIS